MRFTKAISSVFRKSFVWSGRASRSEFAWFLFLEFIVFTSIFGICFFVSHTMQLSFHKIRALSTTLCVVYLLIILMPKFSLRVRRLHDMGLSAWFFIWWLIILCILFFIREIVLVASSFNIDKLTIAYVLELIIMLQPGDEGENRFDKKLAEKETRRNAKQEKKEQKKKILDEIKSETNAHNQKGIAHHKTVNDLLKMFKNDYSIGDEIAKRYVVESIFEQNVTRKVFKCFDMQDKVHCAIMIFPAEISNSNVAMEEIRDSVSILKEIDHPSICKIEKIEFDKKSKNYYLVMDYFAGNTFRNYMRQNKNVCINDIAQIIEQVAIALDFAHSNKILHRELIPENILVDENGNIKLINLFISDKIRSLMTQSSDNNQYEHTLIPYMSPEQWKAKRLTAASDQYSLAVIVYELLSGEPPFMSNNIMILREAVINEEPEKINDISNEEQLALYRAMSKEPSSRYASCVDFVKCFFGRDIDYEISFAQSNEFEKCHSEVNIESQTINSVEQSEDLQIKSEQAISSETTKEENEIKDLSKVDEAAIRVIYEQRELEEEKKAARNATYFILCIGIMIIGLICYTQCYNIQHSYILSQSENEIDNIESVQINLLQKVKQSSSDSQQEEKEINVPLQVSSLEKAKQYPKGILFSDDYTELIKYPEHCYDTVYEIPSFVTRIGEYAFIGCGDLRNIIIPNSVTSICENAFAKAGCFNLHITIPNSVVFIGEGAFFGVDKVTLERGNKNYIMENGVLFNSDKTKLLYYPESKSNPYYVIPWGVRTIGNRAFPTSYRLEHISIPNSVTRIGSEAFNFCYSVENLMIPNSVTFIGEGAFFGVDKVTLERGNKNYIMENGVLFNSDKTQLLHYPRSNSDPYYVIPQGVRTIGNYAFVLSENLECVVIPNSVSSMGKQAFSGSSIRSASIPEGVTTIGDNTFWMCKKLESIVIPHSVVHIGKDVFDDCDNLQSIFIPYQFDENIIPKEYRKYIKRQ